ncbi:MAG: hypothetical protein NWE84_07625 [Candidatus Bathyarchaeota archaeon]|nr:hypothetical protein [Candidatus Bathyarchaeota archaeon]
MLIQTKLSRTVLSLFVAAVIVTSILATAKGTKDGFVVQNVQISPKVATNGENVRVKANLRNMENKTKNCCITAFVGESVVEEPKEITFSAQETISLLFTVNTSALPEGQNSIDLVVEQPTNKQEIFDLGNIVVAQENVEQESVEQESLAISNVLYLIPIFLIGAVVSFLVCSRKRKKIIEQKLPEDLLPNLLNQVLNFEEKVEEGAEKTKSPSDDRNYIR